MGPYEESNNSRATWCLGVNDREFMLYLMEGDTVILVDEAAYRGSRPPEKHSPELRAILGDAKAAKQIWRERQEFSVTFQIDSKLTKRWLKANKTIETEGDITKKCEAEIDALLLPYFWREVNHLLSNPIPK